MTSVSVNSKQFDREIKRFNRNLNTLRKGETTRAMQSVLNRGITTIRKSAVKDSSKSLGLKQKVVKNRFSKYRRAKPNDLSIQVGARTKAINSVVAGAKQTDDGLRLGPYEWSEGFVIRSPKSNRLIGVQRKTKKRLPLKAAELGKKFVYREFKSGLHKGVRSFQRGDFRLELYKEMSKRFDRLMK